MKKYYIITIVILFTSVWSLAALYHQKTERFKRLEKQYAAYALYYNASEELFDLLEKEDVLEPYLESDEGAEYLKRLNNIIERNYEGTTYPAKLLKPLNK